MDPDLVEAMKVIFEGDPATEPVFEIDSLGAKCGTIRWGRDEFEDEDNSSRPKKTKLSNTGLVKGMKESTEEFMKKSSEQRDELTCILNKNSDLLEKLVNHLTQK